MFAILFYMLVGWMMIGSTDFWTIGGLIYSQKNRLLKR